MRRETIGTTAGHARQQPTPVDAYTLDGGAGLSITVWTYGATLVDVLAPDRRGHIANVVLRLPSLAAYEAGGHYVGATLGRYARCVAGARFRIDDVEYELEANAGRHHVHGGALGFDRFVWEAEPGRDAGAVWVRLRLERPEGDGGYPGAVAVETVYRVEGRRLTIEHRATTTASTVVDLTNHAFWNLAGGGTIDRHRLRINAARVLMVDADLIPVGAPVDVRGTEFDYSAPRLLAGTRLDHCFPLHDGGWAAELCDPSSGRALRIVTDQPGLQVYSGDGLPAPRTGICLQTGSWPNAPNRPDYPPARLDPGQTYHHRVTHDFLTL